MLDNEYWDESEFSFFNTLEDEDKLLYLYDLMVGEFAHEYNGEDIKNVFEFEFEEEPTDNLRQDIVVSFGLDGKINFLGDDLFVLTKVSSDMMMNGLILSDADVSFEENQVRLTYTLVGEGYPISLN